MKNQSLSVALQVKISSKYFNAAYLSVENAAEQRPRSQCQKSDY